jgi:hypothetical protein
MAMPIEMIPIIGQASTTVAAMGAGARWKSLAALVTVFL